MVMKTAKKVEHLIRRLGANGSYIGFHFSVAAVSKSIKDRRLLLYITKGVYLEVALENNTTVKCVERDIRTVIEVIWKYGDRELLNLVAGRELKEKPNNREFIDMLARFVEEEEPESRDAAITEADIKEDIKEADIKEDP